MRKLSAERLELIDALVADAEIGRKTSRDATLAMRFEAKSPKHWWPSDSLKMRISAAH